MDLSQAQVDTFRREGYLVIEGVFSAPEVAVLEAALPEITDPSRAKVGFDNVSGMVRLSHGAHLYNEAFRRLSLHPRLVRPVQRLTETENYVFQSRLTIKPPMSRVAASGWVWHQDFSTWHRDDGMPEPRPIVTFTFLDDVTAANAPILVIPRSHDRGVYDTLTLNGDDNPDYNVAILPETIVELGTRYGVQALTGPAGTLIFMNCTLAHASGQNISPLRRALFTVTFNSTNNRPTHPRPRDHWLRETGPLRQLDDDCLLTMSS